MGKNKLGQGIIIGALVGAAVSLLDKHTRVQTKAGAGKVMAAVKDPRGTYTTIKAKVDDLRETYETVSEDISYVAQKVKDLQSATPQVKEIVQETKEAFHTVTESKQQE